MEEKKKIFIVIAAVVSCLAYFIIRSNFQFFTSALTTEKPEEVDYFELSSGDKTVVIQVSGEVQRPLIYRVKENSLLEDVLGLAGLKATADLNGLNLADIVIPNAHYKITSIYDDEPSSTTSPSNPGGDNQNQSDLININTATKTQLMTLKGIGEAIANRIIDYRRTNIFYSIEDIKNVPGIGETVFLQASKILLLSNKYHYLAFLIVLVALCFTSQLVIIPTLIYLYFLFKNTDIFLVGLLVVIISFTLLVTSHQSTSSIDINQTEFEVKLIDYIKKAYTNEMLVKYNGEYILVKYNKDFTYKAGDILVINGFLKYPESASFLGDFNYQKYLKNKNIYYILNAIAIKKVKTTFHINKYKNDLLNYFENQFSEETYAYISSLVFANKVFEPSLNQNINKIGLSYLFAISGMHIILIYNFLKRVLKKLIFDDQIATKLTLVIVFVYTLLLQSTSVNRAFLMLLLTFVSKKYKLYLTKLDILSISLILLFFYKPLSIYEISFILSFLVTFVLILVANILTDKNVLKQLYKTSILSFIVSLPISINMNNEINLITLIISPLLSLVFSLLVLPITYLSLGIPIDIFNPVFVIFNKIISVVSEFDLLVYNFRYIKVEYVLIYYWIIFFGLKAIYNKKDIFYRQLAVITLFLLFNMVNLMNPFTKVTFIDVGQGDSTYIELPFNQGNIMIDSFGKNVSYLKTKGVNTLDYLILTHNDLDHTQTVFKLLNAVRVKYIVINYYNDISDYGISDKYNIISVKSDDVLRIGDVDFHVINPVTNYNSDNNLSIGLYFDIGLKFLLTGDMEKEAEKEAINKYGYRLKTDVYKVGHHGSKTSSTTDFIKYVDPKYSIISAGLNNKYNFPHSEVLQNLKNSNIYITFKKGNIDIYCYKSYYRIKTYK